MGMVTVDLGFIFPGSFFSSTFWLVRYRLATIRPCLLIVLLDPLYIRRTAGTACSSATIMASSGCPSYKPTYNLGKLSCKSPNSTYKCS